VTFEETEERLKKRLKKSLLFKIINILIVLGFCYCASHMIYDLFANADKRA
jgi:hypothetical protein